MVILCLIVSTALLPNVGIAEMCMLCAGSSKVQAQLRLEAESILINVAGRLLMFQRDRSASLGKQSESNDRRVS